MGETQDASGNLIISILQTVPEIITDGLVSYFKPSADKFFAGDKVKYNALGRDLGIAKAKDKIEGYTVLTPKGILENEIEAPKYSESIPFSLEIGRDGRIPGASEYTDVVKQTFLAQSLASKIAVLMNRVKRAMNKQAADILTTGKIKFSADNPGLDDVDFGFDNELFANYTKKWLNADGTINNDANPIQDISDRADLIYEKSGVATFDVILDSAAYKGFINNSNVQALIEKAGVKVLETDKTQTAISALNYVGTYDVNGKLINFYVYQGGYKIEATAKKYLPPATVIILAKRGEVSRSIAFAGVQTTSELPKALQQITPTSNITIFGDNKAVDVFLETEKREGTVFLNLTSRPILLVESINTHGSFNVQS